ncbi:MAG: hypothetical protein Q8P41_27625 [Pseudomonadota bacterium]|nr:hypothetical protein [Pseudomonadota bacterium]
MLDVDAPVDAKALIQHVPSVRRARHELSVTEFGYERPERDTPRDGLNWPCLLEAVHRMVQKGQQLRPTDGSPVEIYVSGLAPLSVFFTLGTVLDTRTALVTAVNLRRNEATWDVLRLVPAVGPTFFDPPTNVDPGAPHDASGRVGLFISALGPSVSGEAVRAAAEHDGDRLAGVVKIATPGRAVLDATNVGPCTRELTDTLSALAVAWPARSGLTVFLAGPAPLALAAGICLNRNQYMGGGATIDVTEYVAGKYVVVGRLPLPPSRDPIVPDDSASLLVRRRTFDAVKRGVVSLKDRLELSHMRVPTGFVVRPEGREALAKSVHRKLQLIRLGEEPIGQDFWLSTTKGQMSFGHGLLHALLGLDERVLERLGQLFVLHELVHDPQNITSNTFRGIGRAGVVLEDLDFWADAFAISVAFDHQVARGGDAAREGCRNLLLDLIDAHIAAMRAFDRMEQGDVLHTVPERRLRRYLMWYLQRARAETVGAPEHAHLLFDVRVFVEIAPLKGRLDDRNDKIATGATPDAELFVTSGGRLIRMQRSPGFVPAELFDAVRTFNEQALHEAMDRVVDAGRAVLAPWVDG